MSETSNPTDLLALILAFLAALAIFAVATAALVVSIRTHFSLARFERDVRSLLTDLEDHAAKSGKRLAAVRVEHGSVRTQLTAMADVLKELDRRSAKMEKEADEVRYFGFRRVERADGSVAFEPVADLEPTMIGDRQFKAIENELTGAPPANATLRRERRMSGVDEPGYGVGA